ncbi:protein PROCA1 isoform X2 [Fukomys damarensis]|uniref:protein PROCA1 isoform X2 n=1 Tax=Fukomys damarensis TaxID=885580 RepID=UPI00053F4CA7|nr:protein PROCA1 isoform X2 [Fukomys damarensis]
MWVRTTVTIERWTEENINRLPSWERRHPLPGVAPSTDASTFLEGECKESDGWKHKQCSGHIIHPFSDCGHHNLHLHAVSRRDCDSRLKVCSEKANSSSSWDSSSTCSRDVGSTCFNIIQNPCFPLIPEEECVERFWRKSYRPVSVTVIHHPIHHECETDDLNEEEEEGEEEEEESKPSIPTQVGPIVTPTDPGKGTIPGAPDSAAPITIWRSESPIGKSQGNKVTKKVKKKKENEKDKEEEMTDEKAKLKKKAKKGKLMKKKSPMKSESSPADLSHSLSPRELARMSESSPESRRDLENEDSYHNRRQEEPSSEDIMESSSPRKREKSTTQAKKNGTKTSSQAKKVTKRKSPPVSNPNLS